MRKATEVSIREANELDARYPYVPNVDQCASRASVKDEHGTRQYRCTRPRNHDGPHIAHAPKGPVATWPSWDRS